MTRSSRSLFVLSLAFLSLVALPSPASAAGKKNLIKVFFLNTGVQTEARGKLTMVVNKAQTFFKIRVSHASPGTYDVLLDGAVVDTLTVSADGTGKVRHRQRNRGRLAGTPLPYDPAGGQLAIAEAGTTLLEAEVPESPDEAFDTIRIETVLANLGVVPGEADAVFRERFGRMKLRVELEDVAEGDYDLMVDGAMVAGIHVDATGRGEVEFDSRPETADDDHEADDGDDGLDLLLTFDPRGKTISVEQAGTSLFSSMFPTEPAM